MGCFEVSTNLKEIGCFKVSTNLNEIGCFKVTTNKSSSGGDVIAPPPNGLFRYIYYENKYIPVTVYVENATVTYDVYVDELNQSRVPSFKPYAGGYALDYNFNRSYYHFRVVSGANTHDVQISWSSDRFIYHGLENTQTFIESDVINNSMFHFKHRLEPNYVPDFILGSDEGIEVFTHDYEAGQYPILKAQLETAPTNSGIEAIVITINGNSFSVDY